MNNGYDFSQMFTDGRFRRIGGSGRKYLGIIGDRRVAVVLATKNPAYSSVTLNRAEYDSAMRAKDAGKVDEVHVVAVAMNGGGSPKFIDQIDGDQLGVQLATETPRTGRFGEFFALTPGNGSFPSTLGDDEIF